jgi:alcohol dehydrogenase (cytochrome c)/quinohemoprotein ethanol dehydrogenase
VSRILVFKLDGKETLPTLPVVKKPLDPPANTASAQEIQRGMVLYHRTCFACHGDTAVSGGVIPDLRYTSRDSHRLWNEIVLKGLLKSAGMVSFSEILSETDSGAIQAYVIKRAHDAKEEFDGGVK